MTDRSLGSLQRYDCDQRSVELQFARGRMRIAGVDEGMVRVRATFQDEFATRRSWDVVALEREQVPATVTVQEEAKRLRVAAAPLRVTVSREDGCVTFADEQGNEIAPDIAPLTWQDMSHMDSRKVIDPQYPSIALAVPATLEGELGTRARTAVSVTKAMAPDEVYYGFGERIGLLDRRGRTMTNWNIDPPTGLNRGQDNLYQSHPFFLAVRPGLAWGLFLHSTWYSQFDVGAKRWEELELMTLGGEMDYYVLYGPTPAQVIERLTRLTGRPAVPPLWSLGYHQSRWGYKTQDQVRSVARGFQERAIPLDAIHLDIDYMCGYRDFTFDPERFPEPEKLIGDLREQGTRTVTIIDPGIKKDLEHEYEPADDGVAHDVFIRNPDGTLYCGYCWPDAALFPDFTRREVREWWGGQHRGYVEKGVAGIWDDMNEPAIFDRPFSAGFSAQDPMPPETPQGPEGERTIHAEVHNVYGLLMSRATYEGLLRLRPGERPWVLTRSGYTGMQVYAATWMGDNSSWWEHLAGSLPQLMSMGLSGVPYVGVDIGGFHGNAIPEMYARWIEAGTFYPFMRTHTVAGTRPQEPWSFGPEVEEIARQAILLRYRLLPYLYTLAHQTHRTGAPILRPLVYDFPDDPATYHVDDQAMFGPHLLIAPVLRPGQVKRAVYLPEGRWFDYWTGRSVDGPHTMVVDAPLARIPLFVRGGAVLPLGNERLSTSAPLTILTLGVYPAGDSAFTLIEDDGTTTAYQEGEMAETSIRVAERQDRLTVDVAARQGSFHPHPRTMVAHIHTGRPPTGITFDGQRYGDTSWDAEREVIEVRWEDDGASHRIECSSAE